MAYYDPKTKSSFYVEEPMETDYEPETVEQEERDHAIATITAEGDPLALVASLEKKAELSGRMRTAIETVLISQTYPSDWTIQGDGDKAKACLGSAGAERVGRIFGIKHHGVQFVKEDFTDQHGAGYRYIFMGYATLEGRQCYVQGSYSTRDKFLGFKNDEWRPVEDINEGHIRNAAFHVFCGNAVKELLGLRGLPASEYQRIMGRTGRDGAKSSSVQRGRGTEGGSSAKGDDRAHQKELGDLCVEFANAGQTVEKDAEDKWHLVPLSDGDDRSPLDVAKDICIRLSTFEGDKGLVKGKLASQLTGKWLGSTLGKARDLKKELEAAPWDNK